MLEVPTHPELMEIGKTAALLNTNKLTDRSFDSGFLPDLINGLSASVAQEVTQIAIALHRATFFRTATGDELDRLGEDHFGLVRQSGAAAVGTVTFTRPSAGTGNILIPAGTRVATEDGVEFITTSEPLLTGLSISVDIRAQTIGSVGIVESATITTIVDSLADPAITVSNTDRTAGGIGRESDQDFRDRITGFLATVRRGTVGAVEFGALGVAGVVRATVDETSFPPTLYIADVNGGANLALVQDVVDVMPLFRSAGIPVNVVGATVLNQAIDLSFTFRAGIDTAGKSDAAIAAVVAFVNALDIGEKLFRSAIVATARLEGIVDVVVNTPTGDVAPALNELIRTAVTLVTLT